ncbi:hypothetical protein ACP4OV_029404 [Aristida adscensionis]
MALVKSNTTKIMRFTTAVFLALLIMSPNFLSCQAGNFWVATARHLHLQRRRREILHVTIRFIVRRTSAVITV